MYDAFYNFCLCSCHVCCTSFWFAPCFYILFNVHMYMCANVCVGVCESGSVHACVFSQRPERMFCTVMYLLYCLRTWSLTEPEAHLFFFLVRLCLSPSHKPPLLGLQKSIAMPGFCADAGDLNSGPHACWARFSLWNHLYSTMINF